MTEEDQDNYNLLSYTKIEAQTSAFTECKVICQF
jgi:hypothetical protein